MENEKCKEVRQTTLQFRCEKIPHAGKSGDNPVSDTERMKIDENQDCGCSLASPTPEKITQPPRSRKSKGNNFSFGVESENPKMLPDSGDNNELTVEVCEKRECRDVSDLASFPQDSDFSVQSREEKKGQLPEKCKIIAELFDKVVTSVRLLCLRKRLASFQNISTQVEILAKRKLVLNHLAQMKYLFSEAIHIEKILVHDKTSLCMKPVIKISLILDAARKIHGSQQPLYVDLCQAFCARLLDFINTHPEGTVIPEAPLPDSFNLGDPTISSNQLPVETSMEQSQFVSADDNPILDASHLCPSFSGHFSQRILAPEKQMAEASASSISMTSMDAMGESNGEINIPLKNDCSYSLPDKSPTEMIYSSSHDSYSHLHQRTPVKLISTPVKLTTETPVLSTPKRPVDTPDVKLTSQSLMLSHSTRRSLVYSPSKSDVSCSDPAADITDSLCYKTPYYQERDAKRSFNEDERSGYHIGDLQMAQENATDIVNYHDLSQSAFNKRWQMLASLPDLFYTINFVFGSKNCTSITKQELVYKILSCNCDIEDAEQVEEQLHLLEELVPDWICGKTLTSGDFVYSISRTCDLEYVRGKLTEAV